MKSRVKCGIRVIVLGSSGRTGSRLVEAVGRHPLCSPAAALDLRTADGRAVLKDLAAALPAADVVIDFTSPAASVRHAALCARHKKPIVIGTTGFSSGQLARIREFSKKTPVFLSPNMSPAVNLSMAVARLMAARLRDFDIHISEAHHKAKKDAPSGTALKYKERIREVHAGPVAVSSIRAGDIVGEHAVLFAGPHERLELVHRAHSRDVFAAGALRAALWLKGKRPGLYDYFDLLALGDIR